MINAIDAYNLKPSTQHMSQRRKELIKNIESSIIAAAGEDQDSLEFSFDAIDANYLFDILREKGYEYVIRHEQETFNPHHTITICIYWRAP